MDQITLFELVVAAVVAIGVCCWSISEWQERQFVIFATISSGFVGGAAGEALAQGAHYLANATFADRSLSLFITQQASGLAGLDQIIGWFLHLPLLWLWGGAAGATVFCWQAVDTLQQ